MKVIYELPTLFGKSSSGKTKVYKSCVIVKEDENLAIIREHGQLSGKLQIDEKVVTSGKNLGKANETSPEEQAIFEAKSYWSKKVDSGYTEDPNQSSKHLLPMLAQSFQDSGHRIKYPCYVQPKLNGVRCLAHRVGDKIEFTSRKGKSYNETLGHIVQPLLSVMEEGQIFDGEIYTHGIPFETLVSYVKKLRPESTTLQYHVYDIADESLFFEERYKKYSSQISGEWPIISVRCQEVLTSNDIKTFHDAYVQEGYEGIIIRNKGGLYTLGHRSSDLQKLKEFEEGEFKIIGGRTPDTGRLSGGCVFLCETPEGKTFEVVPRGTMELRKQYYQDLPNLIGHMLTVRYQSLSTEDHIPLFPVGICPRTYEGE
jgi:DNA ligase-1